MRRALVAAVIAFGVLFMPAGSATAENEVRLGRSSALIGEHVSMTLKVTVPAGATVELTPGTPSWVGVELVRIERVTRVPQAGSELWVIDAVVAPFVPGDAPFAPSVAVIVGAEASSLVLPPVGLKVIRTLALDAELELSALAPAVEIGGAQSSWLVPGVVTAILGAVSGLVLLSWLVARSALRRLRRVAPRRMEVEAPPTLAAAEQLLHSDPVGAYRVMASVVKTELARRYAVRATALTTNELRRKLESGGERWEARLVAGLLEECDSVIYAGYRPAAERREADLTMAREIIGVAP